MVNFLIDGTQMVVYEERLRPAQHPRGGPEMDAAHQSQGNALWTNENNDYL